MPIHPHLIPWKSRSEWVEVYEDAYSKDYTRTKRAVELMTSWRQFMRKSFRPGMDCTRGLLHIALRDDHIFPAAEQILGDSELQLMYSAEIMRFLNIAGCSSKVKTDRKVSLYGRAKELGIEDWVVNLRHQTAHGGNLPPLAILRMALRFVLQWLQKEYWEVEKKGMIEVKLRDPGEVVSENLIHILKAYISLKEQNILGFKKVKDIQDPDVKHLLSCINSFSLNHAKASFKPWDLNPTEDIKINIDKLNNSLTNKAIFNVLKLLKQYIDCEEICGTRPLNVLLDNMIEDSVNHSGMRRDVWNSLLRALHSWYKFPDMIKYFCAKSFEMRGEVAYQAGIWCAELCKALHKRYEVELLSDCLIKQVRFGKVKGRKRINLNSNELKELQMLLVKKKLNMLEKNDSRIFAWMFVRVEEKNRDIRDVLRLKEAIYPEHWELMDLIECLVLAPTPFTEQSLCSLYQILKWPFGEERLQSLLALTRIYQGEGVQTRKGRRLYKLSNLEQAVTNKQSTTEEEGWEMETSQF